ncbi:hypothetical protein [Lysobacter gummosus]|uniref:hypothetical protein n=1 Tax=Lysobacter gummosus TaxID=262324 RepID=UPI00363333EA
MLDRDEVLLNASTDRRLSNKDERNTFSNSRTHRSLQLHKYFADCANLWKSCARILFGGAPRMDGE